MVINCKERFGYTYLWTCDRTMCNVLYAYCEGRSRLWNTYLGWRKTTKDEKVFFWIPSNKIENLIDIAKEIKEFEKRA